MGLRRREGKGAQVAAALSLLVALGPLACGNKHARMPPKPDGVAVVVTAAEQATEVGFRMADEVEPNDLIAGAQPMTPTLEAGTGIIGHLIAHSGAKAKDVDLYRVTVPPPAVVEAAPDGATAPVQLPLLRIEAHPDAALILGLDVVDEQGKVIISSTGSAPGEVQGIPNLAVGANPVFVRVRSVTPPPPAKGAAVDQPAGTKPEVAASNDPFGYRLTVRLAPAGPGEEAEPNGKAALANPATLDNDVAGFLGWRHDEDWYSVPTAGLPEGGVLSAELDALEGVAASLAVYDAASHKMLEQRGRKGDRVALRNVRLPASDPNVFVVVSADSGRNLDTRYILHLRSEEAKSDAEIEPNDDPAHAVALADGTLTGTLGPGDADVFRYTAPVPTELNVEVQPPAHVDVKLEVLREDGTVILKSDAGKRGAAERLPNLFVSGSVLLRVQGQKGEGSLDEPYHLTATGCPIEVGAEHESNNTAALASVLPSGTTGSGLIFPKGDVDFWRTAAPAGGDSTSVSVRGVPGLTLDVRIRTPSGRELAKLRVGGDAAAPTQVPRGPDGCCLIEIREATGRASNAKDRYSLSVTP